MNNVIVDILIENNKYRFIPSTRSIKEIIVERSDVCVIPAPDVYDFIAQGMHLIALVQKQEAQDHFSDLLAVLGKEDRPDLIGMFSDFDIRRSYGRVYIAGAGPGDAELMTLKTARILKSVDVIVYDALVDHSLLDRNFAEKIFVGKRREKHSKTQDEINDIIYQYARQGKHVCRLKGGDPFIFGRGGEEVQYLRKRFVDVEVVPGITAAQAAAASAEVPFTQRGVSASVAFCTGAPVESISVPQADTLVYYMGATNLRIIAEKVIVSGRKPETSVALIQNVTTLNEKIIITSLQDIVLDKTTSYESPLIIIIGNVAKERHKGTFIKETGIVLHNVEGHL